MTSTTLSPKGTFVSQPLSAGELVRVFERLEHGFEQSSGASPTLRWQWLEAAHVAGQWSLPLHWRSHVLMLSHAWSLRDWREMVGQLLRLALVLPGHLVQRLPAGNIGRATVAAMKPMPPQPQIEALIADAIAAVRR